MTVKHRNFKKLKAPDHKLLNMRAAAAKRAKVNEQVSEVEHLRVMLQIHKDRARSEIHAESGVVNKVSSFRMNNKDRDAFETLFAAVSKNVSFAKLQAQFPGSVAGPDEDEKDVLEETAIKKDNSSVLPEWLKGVCRNRTLFLNTAFIDGDVSVATVAWAPWICMQNPNEIVWERLDRVVTAVPESFLYGDQGDAPQEVPLARVRPVFRYTGAFSKDLRGGVHSDESLWVLDDLLFCYDDCVLAATAPVSFDDFTRHHPKVKTTSTNRAKGMPRRKREHDEITAQLLEEMPFLTAKDLGLAPKKSSVSKERSDMPPTLVHGDPDDDVSDSASEEEEVEATADAEAKYDPDVVEVLKTINETRDEWEHDPEREMYFYVHNRGGYDLAKRTGKGLDSATAFARSEALRFCKLFKWPRQKGFMYSKYDGVTNPNMLAREWCRLGHWYCLLWTAAGEDESYEFTEDDRCPPDKEFIEWACTVDPMSSTWPKIMEVQAAFPGTF